MSFDSKKIRPSARTPAGADTFSIGMCVAIDLIRRYNCQNFVIVERSGGFAGTWRDNTYPGGCCDGELHAMP